jgi:hypothetical protein
LEARLGAAGGSGKAERHDPVVGVVADVGTAEEIARDWCARAGIAFLGSADIGHDAANRIVPFGLARTPARS